MTMDERVEAAENALMNSKMWPVVFAAGAAHEVALIALAAAFPELHGDQPKGWIAPWEPETAMKRALIRDRGYDPDAKEDTLDHIGQLDIMTMGQYLRVYGVMRDAYLGKGDGG